jgi:hypothetical protein
MSLLDRRQFLKLFSAAFVMKALGDQAFCRSSLSYFESGTLGLRFAVPQHWHAMDGISALKVLDEQILTRDDPNNVSATPLMVYTRHQEPYPTMNPSVGLFVDEWGDWMGASLSNFADACFDHYSSLLSEPVHELRPVAVTLSNHVWQRSIVTFGFVGASGFMHRVRMRTCLTFLRRHLVTLNMTDSENCHETAAEEFSAIEPSITIRS